MPNLQKMDEVVYHGYRLSGDGSVIAVECPTGEHIRMLRHVVRHSPSGLSWGYLGSGPCDTARSLLLDALGEDALCPECQGFACVVYVADGDGYRGEPFDPVRHPWAKRGSPCACSDGYRMVPYMDFVDIVAEWGEEWVMTRSRILAWLEQAEADQCED